MGEGALLAKRAPVELALEALAAAGRWDIAEAGERFAHGAHRTR
jgi:hypothetical protein